LFFSFAIIFAQLNQNQQKSDLFSPFSCTFVSLNHFFNSSDSLIKLAFVFVVLLIAFSYMLGNLFKNPNIIFWAKNELVNLFWSAILIFLIGVAISISCFSIAYFASQTSTQFGMKLASGSSATDIIINYLDSLISAGKTAYFYLMSSSLDDIFDSTETIVVGKGGFLPFSGSGGITYKAGKREWAAYKEMLGMYLGALLAAVYAQQLLFSNLFPLILSFVLPVAIFLRIIPIFREVGDFLLAICIVLYLFLPTFYVIMLAALEKTNLISWASDPSGKNDFLDLSDSLVGNTLVFIAYFSIHAVFIPNLLLVILVTASMELYKAIKGFFS